MTKTILVPVEPIQSAITRYNEMMDAIGGCTDGGCVVKRPKGMHTNGGCRCWTNQYTAQRVMRHAQVLRDAISTALPSSHIPTPTEDREEVARALCRLKILFNYRFDEKRRDADFIKRAEDAGYFHFMDEADAAISTLQALGWKR